MTAKYIITVIMVASTGELIEIMSEPVKAIDAGKFVLSLPKSNTLRIVKLFNTYTQKYVNANSMFYRKLVYLTNKEAIECVMN